MKSISTEPSERREWDKIQQDSIYKVMGELLSPIEDLIPDLHPVVLDYMILPLNSLLCYWSVSEYAPDHETCVFARICGFYIEGRVVANANANASPHGQKNFTHRESHLYYRIRFLGGCAAGRPERKGDYLYREARSLEDSANLETTRGKIVESHLENEDGVWAPQQHECEFQERCFTGGFCSENDNHHFVLCDPMKTYYSSQYLPLHERIH